MSLAGEARQHSHELCELDTVYKLVGNFKHSKHRKNVFFTKVLCRARRVYATSVRCRHCLVFGIYIYICRTKVAQTRAVELRELSSSVLGALTTRNVQFQQVFPCSLLRSYFDLSTAPKPNIQCARTETAVLSNMWRVSMTGATVQNITYIEFPM